MEYDAVIIGAGACGLMCAAQAGMLGKRTLVIEGNDRVGAKILISGGGRCNFTNLYTSIDNFVSENPHFLHGVFSQWTVEDTCAFFERHGGIQGQEKTLGQLFPSTNKAKDIVAVFSNLLDQTDQEIWLNARAEAFHVEDDVYRVDVDYQGQRQEVRAKKVVIASGGLPVAKLGASDFALRVARQLDLNVVRTAPALVPLTVTGNQASWYASLSGNTVFARVWNQRVSFEENILFTHWGLSGPAILQISSYWRPGEVFSVNLLPNADIAEQIKAERNRGGKRTIGQLLGDFFSRRLVEALATFLPTDIKIASLSKADAKHVAECIHRFQVKAAGDKGYNKAEVMRGGIATDELNPKTLEVKKFPGLYFGGEAVDITGWLGGYNFQWAWSAGYAIAQDL